MPVLLMLGTCLIQSSQNIFIKFYNNKCQRPNPYVYSMISTFFAWLFSLISSGFQLHFTAELIPYALVFGIMYVGAIAGTNLALSAGPLSLTSIFGAYNILIPIFYGVLFLNDPMKVTAWIGLILLLIALYVTNMKREEQKMKITFRWVVYVIIFVIGNGMASTILKMQQTRFAGMYKNEFMVMGIGIAFVMMVVLSLSQSKNIRSDIRACSFFAPLTGIANGIGNIALMFTTAVVPNAILFPSLSGLGGVITYLAFTFLFHEKLSKQQKLGYLLSMVSTIIINL